MKTVEERCDDLLKLYLNNNSEETGSFNIEFLLDTLTCLYYECKLPQHRNERNCLKFCKTVKHIVEKIEACRLSRSEFETVRLIGSGAFGEVSLVKSKRTREIFALKSLHKYDMLKRSDRACFQEEREVLVKAMIKGSPWISKLHYTFQDEKFLYFVMKFYNGGDMLTMLSKFDDQIPETISRFYLAELVLAINSLHELGYVHRDIKPDNVLIESSGHIVLADFGSCLQIGADGLIKNTAAIGTPDYIAPEILRAAEDSHGTFGVECDYWSLGVVMFEMLFGETPFYSENLIETYSHIMSFEKNFKFPEDIDDISLDAQDLIKHFICDRKQRYGRNGIEEIVKHPFFRDIEWENLRSQLAPYQPEVKSPEDTSNFDIEETTRTHEGPPMGSVFRGCQVSCIGFTFTKDSPLNQIGQLGKKLSSKTQLLSSDGSTGAECIGVSTSTTPPLDSCAKCQSFSSLIQELETKLLSLKQQQQQQSSPLPSVTVATTPIDSTQNSLEINLLRDELTTANTQNRKLTEEMNKIQIAFCTLETRAIGDAHKIDELSKTLIEAQESIEKYRFDLREYEDENEELVKRATDDRKRVMQTEAENLQLLGDLEQKRAELALQRRLLDEHNLGQNLNSVDHQQQSPVKTQQRHVPDRMSDIQGKLKEAVSWAQEAELKLANCETYWHEQQSLWLRERKDLQDRVHEIVQDRTTFYRNELEQEKQHSTVLEQRLLGWETRLVELNQMVDNEWVVKDKLHAAVLRLVADLQCLRNGSSELDFYDVRQSTVVGSEDKLSLNGFTVSSNGGMTSLDWRQRKSTKIQKMERANLQLALNNAIQERETATQQVRDLEGQVEELLIRLHETEGKWLQADREKDVLKDQLVKMNSEVRRMRMTTADVEEVIKNLKPELLNGHRKSMETESEITPPLPPRLVSTSNGIITKSESKSLSLGSGTSAVTGVDAGGGSSTSGRGHRLIPETFPTPTKCRVCSNLLLGQQWQGLRCRQCAFSCHMQCRQVAPTNCPDSIDSSSARRSLLGVDAVCGLGTILDGPVKTPKGDIKRGWVQQYVYFADTRLFFYDCTPVRRARPIRTSLILTENSVNKARSVENLIVINKSSTASVASIGDSLFPASSNLPPQVAYEIDYDIHGCSPTCILDIHSPGFTVSRVVCSDVIHAKRNEVPNILKIEPDDHTGASPVYLLFDTVQECERWHSVLEENIKMLNRNFTRMPDNQYLQVQEISDTSFPLAKNILSACVLDENRIILGADDGLYTVDLRYKMYARVGDKKAIHQVEALPEELQLVVVIQDKQRRLRLVLLGAIEGMNYDRIRVAEPKRCAMFVTGWSAGHSVYLICATGQTSIWVYEVVRVPSRHRRVVEIRPNFSDGQSHLVQSMNLVRDGDWLAVGFNSSVVLYNIWDEGAVIVLLDSARIDLDPSLLIFRQGAYEAQLTIQLSFEEFLLVFDSCGVYVNSQGENTRSYHLFWPAKPLSRGFAFRAPHLYCFTDVGLFIFHVDTGVWLGSLGGRRLQPLAGDGHLCLLHLARPPGVAAGFPSSTSQQLPASLVYLPPPLPPISSVRRRRKAQNIEPRALELSTVVPLDSTARIRKSRRFSWLSRGNGSGLPMEADASMVKSCEILNDTGNTSTNPSTSKHTSVFTKARSSTMFMSSRKSLSSRLISAPSDFRHVEHRGPDVLINCIDLGATRLEQDVDEEERHARHSTGNFSSCNDSASVGSEMNPVGSLHSVHSTEHSVAASASSHPCVDRSPTPSCENMPVVAVAGKTPNLELNMPDSPGFRNEVMALFAAFGTDNPASLTSQQSETDNLQTPTNPDYTQWST